MADPDGRHLGFHISDLPSAIPDLLFPERLDDEGAVCSGCGRQGVGFGVRPQVLVWQPVKRHSCGNMHLRASKPRVSTPSAIWQSSAGCSDAVVLPILGCNCRALCKKSGCRSIWQSQSLYGLRSPCSCAPILQHLQVPSVQKGLPWICCRRTVHGPFNSSACLRCNPGSLHSRSNLKDEVCAGLPGEKRCQEAEAQLSAAVRLAGEDFSEPRMLGVKQALVALTQAVDGDAIQQLRVYEPVCTLLMNGHATGLTLAYRAVTALVKGQALPAAAAILPSTDHEEQLSCKPAPAGISKASATTEPADWISEGLDSPEPREVEATALMKEWLISMDQFKTAARDQQPGCLTAAQQGIVDRMAELMGPAGKAPDAAPPAPQASMGPSMSRITDSAPAAADKAPRAPPHVEANEECKQAGEHPAAAQAPAADVPQGQPHDAPKTGASTLTEGQRVSRGADDASPHALPCWAFGWACAYCRRPVRNSCGSPGSF